MCYISPTTVRQNGRESDSVTVRQKGRERDSATVRQLPLPEFSELKKNLGHMAAMRNFV